MKTAGTITTYKQFWLNEKDFIKGLATACAGAVLTSLYEALKLGITHLNWQTILQGALTAGLAYLVKNFITPSATIIAIPPIATPIKAETPVIVEAPTLIPVVPTIPKVPPVTPIPDPHTIIINPIPPSTPNK